MGCRCLAESPAGSRFASTFGKFWALFCSSFWPPIGRHFWSRAGTLRDLRVKCSKSSNCAFPDTQISQSARRGSKSGAPSLGGFFWEGSAHFRTPNFFKLKKGAEVAPILWVISLLKIFPEFPRRTPLTGVEHSKRETSVCWNPLFLK